MREIFSPLCGAIGEQILREETYWLRSSRSPQTETTVKVNTNEVPRENL